MLLRYAHHQIFVFIGESQRTQLLALYYPCSAVVLTALALASELCARRGANCTFCWAIIQELLENEIREKPRVVSRLSGNLFVITTIAGGARGSTDPPPSATLKNKKETSWVGLTPTPLPDPPTISRIDIICFFFYFPRPALGLVIQYG